MGAISLTVCGGVNYLGGFDAEGELLMLVHGQVAPAMAAGLVGRLQRVGQDFAQLHLATQRASDEQQQSYTLLVGMRS